MGVRYPGTVSYVLPNDATDGELPSVSRAGGNMKAKPNAPINATKSSVHRVRRLWSKVRASVDSTSGDNATLTLRCHSRTLISGACVISDATGKEGEAPLAVSSCGKLPKLASVAGATLLLAWSADTAAGAPLLQGTATSPGGVSSSSS